MNSNKMKFSLGKYELEFEKAKAEYEKVDKSLDIKIKKIIEDFGV